MRFLAVPLAAALVAFSGVGHAAAADEAAPASDPAPGPDSGAELGPGTQLMAVEVVILDKAEIAKGSRVEVAQLLRREGKVAGARVALADGHVVSVGLATIRNFFRVVEP